MKRTFIMLSALFLLVGATNAQDSAPQKEQNTTQADPGGRVHKVEHLVFLNGKLYRTQMGQISEVTQEIRTENGLSVKPNGVYQVQSGKRHFLRDGECLDMVGNRYANLTDFNNNKVMHPAIKAKDHKATSQKMNQKADRG